MHNFSAGTHIFYPDPNWWLQFSNVKETRMGNSIYVIPLMNVAVQSLRIKTRWEKEKHLAMVASMQEVRKLYDLAS